MSNPEAPGDISPKEKRSEERIENDAKHEQQAMRNASIVTSGSRGQRRSIAEYTQKNVNAKLANPLDGFSSMIYPCWFPVTSLTS